MTRRPLAGLLLAALAAYVCAAEPRRVELEVPQADVGASRTQVVAPQLVPAAGLAAPESLPSIEPGLAPQAVEAPAPFSGGAAASPQADPGRAAESAAVDGQARFDLARPAAPETPVVADAPAQAPSVEQLVAREGSRKLDGVFIQQEQEGSLLAADPRDSSGNIFRWYRPVEMRPGLMAEVQGGLGGLGKVGYGLRRSVNFWDKDPYKVWDAWPLSAKLDYLGKLEAAVGKGAAWSGKVSLILAKAPGAPGFITANPHMEAPPAGYEKAPGARFLQPEIVSDKASPAGTIDEALSRSRFVISETGHAGTQYHVFVKAEPSLLRAQLAQLQSALQLVNDVLFARAASESFQNVAHPALLPWHAGRSRRVAELLAAAAKDPHTPQAEDADSEKHAFVGLRYWGMEDGKAVVSFELRGASLPFIIKGRSMVRGGELEGYAKPERDYAGARYYLTLLSLFAERLAAGRAPRLSEPLVALDARRADALIAARAAELGVPAGSYLGIEEFSRRLTGSVAPGLLFPFAVSRGSELDGLTDEYLRQSARVKALGPSLDGEKRNIEYMLWQAYAGWARAYAAQAEPRLRALIRASAAR